MMVAPLKVFANPNGKTIATIAYEFTFQPIGTPGQSAGFGQPVNGTPTVHFNSGTQWILDGWKMRMPFEVPSKIVGAGFCLKGPMTDLNGNPQWGRTPDYILWGNNWVPDNLGPWGYGQYGEMEFFPDGLGMEMPALQDADGTCYVDIHGACEVGLKGTAFARFACELINPPARPAPLCSVFNKFNPSDKAAKMILAANDTSVSSDGSSQHGIVRSVVPLCANHDEEHVEFHLVGLGGNAIMLVGLIDGNASVNGPFDGASSYVAIGSSAASQAKAYFAGQTENFGSGGLIDGWFSLNYKKSTGEVTITRQGGPTVTKTLTNAPANMHFGVAMYGPDCGAVTFNAGQSPYYLPVSPTAFAASCAVA